MMRYGLDIRHRASPLDRCDPETLLERPKRFHSLALERSTLGSASFTTTL